MERPRNRTIGGGGGLQSHRRKRYRSAGDVGDNKEHSLLNNGFETSDTWGKKKLEPRGKETKNRENSS